MNLEVQTEFSLRSEGEKNVLRGMASVVYDGSEGTEYKLFGDAVERIAPGAFERALAEGQDVVALFNHRADGLLGRTSSGTLRLEQTPDGLSYEVDLPDTQLGRDVRTLIERGDLKGSSFAFRPTKKKWTRDGKKQVLVIEDLDLGDVSVVTRPAYAGTSASLRSEGDLEALRAEAEAVADTRAKREWLRSLEA